MLRHAEPPKFYSHHHNNSGHAIFCHDGVQLTVSSGSTITHEPAYFEMYDLETDPFEINKIYDTPEYKEVCKTMTAQLNKLRKD